MAWVPPSVLALRRKAASVAGAPLPRPGAPAPAAPAAPPYAPYLVPVPGLPDVSSYVNQGYEASLADIADRLKAQPALWNPQRLQLAGNAQQALYDQGYYENSGGPSATTDAAGNTTYQLQVGPDGRLYRQASQQVNSNANAHGRLYGSRTAYETDQAQTGLNNARESLRRQFAAAQQQSLTSEQSEATDLASSQRQIQGQYGDWRGGQATNAAQARDAIIGQNALTAASFGGTAPQPAPSAPGPTLAQFRQKAGSKWSPAQVTAAYRRLYGGS